MLLDSVGKMCLNMWVKSTPGVNFINTSQNVTREKLYKPLAQKIEHKMILMKLTPGLNFINIFHAAFMCANPKCI